MEKQIVIINGTGGSGKDTFVKFAAKYAKVYNFSSIDLIKEIGSLQVYQKIKGLEWLAEYGWQGSKTEKDRKFLSELKRVWEEYNELPLVSTEKAVENFMHSEQELMFIHIREPQNIEKTINAIGEGEVLTLLIKRENYENIKSNDSDALVDNYNYDYIIPNSNLEDLEVKARNFVEELSSLEKISK